eukprot:Mrub_04294.p1 GENE.Mrub_04294~~Mrub_04294.p1  ORF type:complete len:356 (-),score=16.83 Mrub_04294:51-1118(-)
MTDFFGSPVSVNILLLHPGWSSDDYTTTVSNWCQQMKYTADYNCGPNIISDAVNGYSKYYLTSGPSSCVNKHYVTSDQLGLVMITEFNISEYSLKDRVFHEMTHAFQMTFGGPMPQWLVEGGAVFMECQMSFYTGKSFESCFRNYGGYGGILKNVISLYSGNDIQWLGKYGSDRKACDLIPNSLDIDLTSDQERYLYYDVGAFAVALAIYKANLNNPNDDCQGRNFRDFWNSAESYGFWHANLPYDGIDYNNGFPSDVPDGKGWKKALEAFLGESVEAFYDYFEIVVRPNGTVATEDDLVAYLESATVIETNASISISNRDDLCGNLEEIDRSNPPDLSSGYITVMIIAYIIGYY